MSIRFVSLALLLLTSCSSSPKSKQADNTPAPAPIVTQATAPPPVIVDGSASDSVRTTIEKSNSQIYGAEHAMDPDSGRVSNAQNQGIP